MFNRKLVALPLGIAALAVGGSGAALATTVGSPTSSNSQYIGDSQGANQSLGSGILIGTVNQTGDNTSTVGNGEGGGLSNTQNIGGAASTTVGSANASNVQGTVGIQSVTQGAGVAGTTVGNVTQDATNENTFDGNNTQTINTQKGGVIVGNPGAASNQSQTTSQIANQSEGGGVIVANVSQTGENSNDKTFNNDQTVGSGGTIVGNPQANNSQFGNTPQWIGQTAAGGTVISSGGITQTQDNTSDGTASNTVVII